MELKKKSGDRAGDGGRIRKRKGKKKKKEGKAAEKDQLRNKRDRRNLEMPEHKRTGRRESGPESETRQSGTRRKTRVSRSFLP
jgi:hypothetical protein